jgi:hypothetical protein
VPDPVAGATLGGASMLLTVGNLINTTTQPIVVKSKPIVISGNIAFTFKGTRPTATPTQNADFFYDFDLVSMASEDLIVTITPTIAVLLPLPGGVVDPNLPSLITVQENGVVRSNRQIALPEGSSKVVNLRLSLPNNVNNLRYSLSATASAPGVTQRVETLPPQQVGAASEQPDETIDSFDFVQVVSGPATVSGDTGGVSGVEGTLTFTGTAQVIIEMLAAFSGIPPGPSNHYTISVALDPVGSWVAAVDPALPGPVEIFSPGGSTSVFYDITAPGSASTTIMSMTLTHVGLLTNNKRTVAYRLVRT